MFCIWLTALLCGHYFIVFQKVNVRWYRAISFVKQCFVKQITVLVITGTYPDKNVMCVSSFQWG